MRVVTTCHAAGWEKYGKEALAGWRHWPANAELIWYAEGFDVPATERVSERRCESLERLQAFKAKYAYYRPPTWEFDIVRFSHKVYAVHDALRDHDGIGVWMDADCVAYRDIPAGYIESMLANDAYIALFQRAGWYTETGLWVVNCAHPEHRAFMDAFLNVFESGDFKKMRGWHDCTAIDATVAHFVRRGVIKVNNLSGKAATEEHPMALTEIANYLDHRKGPGRKFAGRSPENKALAEFTKAAA